MRATRQLGTWGTALALAPLLWIGACFAAWGAAQSGYQRIEPAARSYRVPEGPVPQGGVPVTDPLALTELKKYAAIWELEPGACARFPDRNAWPWRWNPLSSSGDLLRLRQKQSFLQTQHHLVFRQQQPDGSRLYALRPDPGAALGGRSFRLQVKNGELVQAWELK
ncbi:MAG TPA: hypothetical protein VFM84_03755 [Holophagaceae bacterium]|nr:hypothetical protein [Holophagaceae bacterium]